MMLPFSFGEGIASENAGADRKVGPPLFNCRVPAARRGAVVGCISGVPASIKK